MGDSSLIDPSLIKEVQTMRDGGANIEELFIQEYCELIMSAWHRLNHTIERHELTIQRQWTSLKTAKRKELLRKAWSIIPDDHRPDITAYLKNQSPTNYTLLGPDFSCPEINLKDLSTGVSLPLLINSRGRHKPAGFARTDLAQFPFHSLLQGKYLNKYVVIFGNDEHQDEYAKLVHMDDCKDAWQIYCRRRVYCYREAVAIFSAHQKIYPFLGAACEVILSSTNISLPKVLDDAFPVRPEPPLMSENKAGSISLFTTVSEARYRLPATLDLDRLEILVYARSKAAEDHLWALRNDPGYYVDTIKVYIDHMEQSVPDAKGRKIDLSSSSHFMETVITGVCIMAIGWVNMWGYLHDVIAELQCIPMISQRLSPDKYVAPRFAGYMMFFKYLLDQDIATPVQHLRLTLRNSPPIRKYFVRQPTNSHGRKWQLVRSGKAWEDPNVERLDWWISVWPNSNICSSFDWNDATVEIERASRASAADNDPLSPWIASQISDLAILHQCIDQIDLHLPLAHRFNETAVDTYTRFIESWKMGDGRSFGIEITNKGNPFHRHCLDCSRDPLNNREGVEAMMEAEDALDSFWAAVDLFLEDNDRVSDRLAQLLNSFSHRRQFTEEWEEPTKSATNDCASAQKPDKPLPATDQSSHKPPKEGPMSAVAEDNKFETCSIQDSVGQDNDHLPSTHKAHDRGSSDMNSTETKAITAIEKVDDFGSSTETAQNLSLLETKSTKLVDKSASRPVLGSKGSNFQTTRHERQVRTARETVADESENQLELAMEAFIAAASPLMTAVESSNFIVQEERLTFLAKPVVTTENLVVSYAQTWFVEHHMKLVAAVVAVIVVSAVVVAATVTQSASDMKSDSVPHAGRAGPQEMGFHRPSYDRGPVLFLDDDLIEQNNGILTPPAEAAFVALNTSGLTAGCMTPPDESELVVPNTPGLTDTTHTKSPMMTPLSIGTEALQAGSPDTLIPLVLPAPGVPLLRQESLALGPSLCIPLPPAQEPDFARDFPGLFQMPKSTASMIDDPILLSVVSQQHEPVELVASKLGARSKISVNVCHWFARRPFTYDMPPLLQPSLPAPYSTSLNTRKKCLPVAKVSAASEHRRRSLPPLKASPNLYLEGLPEYIDPLLKEYFDACQQWSERVASIQGPSDYFVRGAWVKVHGLPGPADIARDLGLFKKWSKLDEALQHERSLAHKRDDTQALKFIEEILAELEVDLTTILESGRECGPNCCNLGDCPGICGPPEFDSDCTSLKRFIEEAWAEFKANQTTEGLPNVKKLLEEAWAEYKAKRTSKHTPKVVTLIEEAWEEYKANRTTDRTHNVVRLVEEAWEKYKVDQSTNLPSGPGVCHPPESEPIADRPGSSTSETNDLDAYLQLATHTVSNRDEAKKCEGDKSGEQVANIELQTTPILNLELTSEFGSIHPYAKKNKKARGQKAQKNKKWAKESPTMECEFVPELGHQESMRERISTLGSNHLKARKHNSPSPQKNTENATEKTSSIYLQLMPQHGHQEKLLVKPSPEEVDALIEATLKEIADIDQDELQALTSVVETVPVNDQKTASEESEMLLVNNSDEDRKLGNGKAESVKEDSQNTPKFDQCQNSTTNDPQFASNSTFVGAPNQQEQQAMHKMDKKKTKKKKNKSKKDPIDEALEIALEEKKAAQALQELRTYSFSPDFSETASQLSSSDSSPSVTASYPAARYKFVDMYLSVKESIDITSDQKHLMLAVLRRAAAEIERLQFDEIEKRHCFMDLISLETPLREIIKASNMESSCADTLHANIHRNGKDIPIDFRFCQTVEDLTERIIGSIEVCVDLTDDQKNWIAEKLLSITVQMLAYHGKEMELSTAVEELRVSTERPFERVERYVSKRDNNPDKIYELKPRLYKVFTSMYWTPTHKSKPASFTWQDFKDAMCAVNLEAEELFGSTWLFCARGWDGILFQAPRSKSAKIPYATARNWGRRLRHWYRLEPHQIQLEKKDAGQASGDNSGPIDASDEVDKPSKKKKKKKKKPKKDEDNEEAESGQNKLKTVSGEAKELLDKKQKPKKK